MTTRTSIALTVALLFAAGGAAWAIRHEGTYAVSDNRLENFPLEILGYRGAGERLAESVYSVLGNDHNVLRRYADGVGPPIWLYIGYYGTAKGGRPSHVPQYCYTGQGFSIEDWRHVAPPDGRPGTRINRMVVKRGRERQLVFFWIQSHADKIPANGVEINLLSLRTRLVGARDDGALVRLSIPIDARGDKYAERVLWRFTGEVIRLLPEYWPVEVRVQA
jgi:EpsI family protein